VVQVTSKTVLLDCQDGVATITLNRPEAHNAINSEMASALRHTMDRVTNDGSIQVILLEGAGPSFCAGGDVRLVIANLDSLDESVRLFMADYNAFVAGLKSAGAITVASIHGTVVGAGLSLASLADICIAADTAVLRPAYADMGIPPDCGGSVGLTAALGPKAALEFLLLTQSMTAREAQAIGLLGMVVPETDRAAETAGVVARLRSIPRHCLTATRDLVRSAPHNALDAQLGKEVDALLTCMATPYYRDAVNRILCKERS
jgi:enoyl-CoA hydratase/carnithine racemase